MSHSAVFVFLLVALTGIATVHGQKDYLCEGLRRGGFGGRCFSSPYNLTTYTSQPKCDSLILPLPLLPPNTDPVICPLVDGLQQGCCIKCSRQTKYCDKSYHKSVGRDECCASELQVDVVRPGSGCICCKECKPKRSCRNGSGKGRCITEHDPVYNEAWCFAQPGGHIKKNRCKGWGCWCCIWNHNPITTTPSK